jgi:hypothetical protein
MLWTKAYVGACSIRRRGLQSVKPSLAWRAQRVAPVGLLKYNLFDTVSKESEV